MNKEIVKYPNPILREKCEEVKEITLEIKELALNMADTMSQNQGVGISAPQVGELKRIIVVRLETGSSAFINPKIVEKTKEVEVGEEGCLSFPELFLKIKRAKSVEIEALNEKGEKICFKAEGLIARVLQHEIDHLDGILFIDRIGFWQKLKIRKKLQKYGSH